MRRQWYGDARDIAKWSILLQLARAESLVEVVQILWLCPDAPKDSTELEGGGPHLREVSADISQAVWNHFRPNLSSVENIKIDGIRIQVPFPIKEVGRKRREYADETLAYLKKVGTPALVFLDPDTGLSPGPNPKPAHVSPDELKRYWGALRPGDWLALYQHQYRSKTWKDESLKRFATAVGIKVSDARCLSLPKMAHDVVFLAAKKGG